MAIYTEPWDIGPSLFDPTQPRKLPPLQPYPLSAGPQIALPPPAAGGAGGSIVPQPPTMGPTPYLPSTPGTPPPTVTPGTGANTPPPPGQLATPTPGTFGPSRNLISTQIDPTPSADTTGARAQLGSLFRGISADAPNRLAIAQNALKTFDEQQADQERLGIQNIGREAAAAGRLGSGMVSTSLGDLQTQLARARLQEERGLAGDVASKTLEDRLAAIGGTEGVLSQLSDLDRSARGELRGERGYQATLDQQALDNLIRRFGLEQGAQAQAFGQEYDTDRLLAELGFGGDTSSTLGSLADRASGRGAELQAGAGDILRRLFAAQQPVPTY